MFSFKKVHTSSRYSRTAQTLYEFVTGLIEDRHASVISLTEVSAEKREAALRKVCREQNFGLITGDLTGMDDSAVMWDKDHWTKVYATTKRIGDTPIKAIGGVQTACALAVLDCTQVKKRGLFVSVHMARSVEGPTGLKKDRWGKRWRQEQKDLKAIWNGVAKLYDCDFVNVNGDWNVSVRRLWVRLMFKRVQPGMTMTWNVKKLPKRGTHGTRIIDISFIRGLIKIVKHPVILPADASSDHNAFIEELGI